MTNKLMAVRKRPMNSVFRGPRASAATPEPKRPAAEEMLKPAVRAAPTVDERPKEAL